MGPDTVAAWRDLFVGMVAAGASLAGLTFVAIALDPRSIERTTLLRLRAASALGCFVGVMFIGIAILTPKPFGIATAGLVGIGALVFVVLLIRTQIRQHIFRGRQPGVNRIRGTVNALGFVLAGVGGLSLAVVAQGWVFYTLAVASMILLGSGIFASWLLVLQIGVPSAEKTAVERGSPEP